MLNKMGQLRMDLEVILRWFDTEQGLRGPASGRHNRRSGPSLFRSIGAVTISGQTTFNFMVNETSTSSDPVNDGREVRLERVERTFCCIVVVGRLADGQNSRDPRHHSWIGCAGRLIHGVFTFNVWTSFTLRAVEGWIIVLVGPTSAVALLCCRVFRNFESCFLNCVI